MVSVSHLLAQPAKQKEWETCTELSAHATSTLKHYEDVSRRRTNLLYALALAIRVASQAEIEESTSEHLNESLFT